MTYPHARSASSLIRSRPHTTVPPVALAGKKSGAFSQGVPVQRPLAHRRVLLSRQVLAYYGLICASRSPRHFMDYGDESPPDGLLWAGPERVPIFLCLSVPFVPSSVPRWMEWLALVVLTTPANLHLLCTGSASMSPPSPVLRWTASRGCKVRFMLRPDGIASPTPAWAFTFELSPPWVTPRGCRVSLHGQTTNSRGRTFTG